MRTCSIFSSVLVPNIPERGLLLRGEVWVGYLPFAVAGRAVFLLIQVPYPPISLAVVAFDPQGFVIQGIVTWWPVAHGSVSSSACARVSVDAVMSFPISPASAK